MAKRSPSEVVDQIVAEPDSETILHLVKRYEGLNPDAPPPEPFDWRAEYWRLHRHHVDETGALDSVIRECARRLRSTRS